MSVSRHDGRRGARHWHTGGGYPPKLSPDDIQRVRELYAIGRVGVPKKLSVREIAAKFGVCHMTIRRALLLDDVELERKRALCNSSANTSAGTSARSS